MGMRANGRQLRYSPVSSTLACLRGSTEGSISSDFLSISSSHWGVEVLLPLYAIVSLGAAHLRSVMLIKCFLYSGGSEVGAGMLGEGITGLG